MPTAGQQLGPHGALLPAVHSQVSNSWHRITHTAMHAQPLSAHIAEVVGRQMHCTSMQHSSSSPWLNFFNMLLWRCLLTCCLCCLPLTHMCSMAFITGAYACIALGMLVRLNGSVSFRKACPVFGKHMPAQSCQICMRHPRRRLYGRGYLPISCRAM